MQKKCGTCKETKPLGDFFSPPVDSRADACGTSEHCKTCHAAAKVPHGYGWYGDRYTSPSDTR